MRTVIVTGGAGYIGSHACKALRQAGFRPVVYDNLVMGHQWAVKWGPLEMGDVTDQTRVEEVFDRHDPVGVIHFAAYAYVGESVEKPAKYYRNNVVGTLTLLEALRTRNVKNFVFSSTCATYGEPQRVPIPVDHPQNPINPYGATKLMIERILRDYDAAYGMRHVALRYFNAAGADLDGEIGEVHEPETHLVPLTIETALGKRACLYIFGSDYPTRDGTAVRDYIHVTDLAEAHVLALQHLLAGEDSVSLNLGTGQGHTVREVVQAVGKVAGQPVPTELAPRRPGDPPQLVADASQSAELLNWTPTHSSLESIVESAWRWHVSRVAEEENTTTFD